jgi:hypothetical protein
MSHPCLVDLTRRYELKLNQIAAATVKVRFGQGVLIPGEMVITAVHCLGLQRISRISIDDTYPIACQTSSGIRVNFAPIFADPLSDVAILRITRTNGFEDTVEFVERTTAARLAEGNLPVEKTICVRILAHTGEWIRGKAWFCCPDRSKIAYEPAKPLAPGTSGGPIVDFRGNLLGVVSTGQLGSGDPGNFAFVNRVIPKWILDRIESQKPKPFGRTVWFD